jgi:hypothetical protein
MWIMVTCYLNFFINSADERQLNKTGPYFLATAILAIEMHLLQASQWLAGWLWGSLATRLCLE